jgi:hypothetical protein
MSVGIWFDPDDITYAVVRQRLRSFDPRAMVFSGVPLAKAQLKKSTIRELARLSWVRSIESNDLDAAPMASPPKRVGGVSDYTNSDNAFNNDGYFASDVKIGVLDWMADGCAMESGHEAFDFATVNYSRELEPCEIEDGTGDSCQDWSDCPFNAQCVEGQCYRNSCSGSCNPGFDVSPFTSHSPLCVLQSNTSVAGETLGHFCVPVGEDPTHASRVSSRISEGYQGDPFHAAAANIWMVNDVWDGNEWVTWKNAYPVALTYLVSNDVGIVNESWYAFDTIYSATDHARDWFSRFRNVLFVKSTGQGTCQQADTLTAGCRSLNSLCVGMTDSDGYTSYDDFSDDALPCGQFWLNPESPTSGNRKDAERPDIVTEGYQASAIEPLTYSDWERVNGSSFAAPAVAGLAGLMAEHCGYGNDVDPVRMRARMRAAAWVPQDFETQFYPNSNPPFFPRWSDGLDSHAGAGLIEASSLKRFCDPPGSSSDPGQPVDGSFDGTGWESLENTEWDWVSEADSDEDSVIRSGETISQGLMESKGALEVVPLLQIDDVDSASRIRFNFSYETCPGQEPGIASYADYSAPAIDYDLAICSDDQSWCVTSESFDDTNEGFDVKVPRSFKELTVLLFKPAAAEGCRTEPEPGYWAGYLWL